MIIFLYGLDSYRSRRKLNELIEHYKKIRKSGLNLRQFDFSKDNFDEFRDEIRQTSMFKEKKLAILKNVFSNSEFEKNFLKIVKSSECLCQNDAIFLFYEEEINKKSPLFNFLIKNAKSQEFALLEGEKLKNWLKKEFKNYGSEIESAAIDKLVDFVGNDSWRLAEEIKKLVSYSSGETIKEEDVGFLVKPKIETNIFKTIEALAQKDKKGALNLIHQHLKKGDNPLYLLSMINYQFRNLLLVKDLSQKYQSYYAISKICGLHPFIARKTYFQAKNFTLEELKRIYQKIFEADLSIKTGKVESEMALDLLITEI